MKRYRIGRRAQGHDKGCARCTRHGSCLQLGPREDVPVGRGEREGEKEGADEAEGDSGPLEAWRLFQQQRGGYQLPCRLMSSVAVFWPLPLPKAEAEASKLGQEGRDPRR